MDSPHARPQTSAPAIPALVDACHALADSGVPDSLDHGDLSADEVILGEMGPVFLDWSDGSITHPFLSAGVAARRWTRRGDEPRVGAYLGPWLAAGDRSRTRAAAMTLGHDGRTVLPLHLAGLYADRILPALGAGAARSDPSGHRVHSGPWAPR